MSSAHHCRKSEDLQRFLLGQLPAEDSEQVQQHLAACPRCLDTVSHLQAGDTLIEAMRAQAQAPSQPEDDVVESLIGRLSGLYRKTETSAVEGPSSGSSSGSGFDPSPREDLAFLAPPQTPDELGRLGDYRIFKVLGAGGMGIVFEAEDPQLHRRVALKVMKPELAARPAERQRFLREAQAMAAIEHDHIVAIYQVSEDRGLPFLAMQLLKGETLEDRLRRAASPPLPLGEGRGDGSRSPTTLPIAEILRIGREIAAGLAAAHAQGLTHRDVKPPNVWLEKSGRVKILDFGLARPVQDDAHLTQSGLIAGTPQYMAPEQAEGQPVDRLCDLFSLGCVLYRLLTGRLPFRGPNTMAVLRALAVEQPQPPHEVRPEVPRALSDLTMRLIAKEPKDRPQSAAGVAESLAEIGRSHLPDGTHPVHREGPARQARPTWTSGRAIVVAAALLLLIAGPLAAWYGPAVYRFATDQGLLVIETDDPDVEVTVKQNGREIKIVDTKTGKDVTLKAGVYQLELSGDRKQGLTLETDQFTLTRGGKEIARVGREQPRASLSDRALLPAPENTGPAGDLPPTRVRLRATLKGHIGTVHWVAFHPHDNLLASAGASGDTTIKLWDLVTEQELATLEGHTSHVTHVAFSPDGKTLASTSWDHTARLWQVESRKEIGTLQHPGIVWSAVFSPDGETLATNADTVVNLWDVATRQVHAKLDAAGPVRSLAFAPDGKTLAVLIGWHTDHNVQFWDVDRQVLRAAPLAHVDGANGVVFTADSKVMVTGSLDRTIKVWDVARGTELATLHGHTKQVHDVALAPDGKMLASCDGNWQQREEPGEVKLWDVAARNALLTLPPHPACVFAVAFSPRGNVLATACADGRIRLWDVVRQSR
jgi:serine/threonine protein kinase/WD40 repeat protein